MGETYTFDCTACDYRTVVSGGQDRGSVPDATRKKPYIIGSIVIQSA